MSTVAGAAAWIDVWVTAPGDVWTLTAEGSIGHLVDGEVHVTEHRAGVRMRALWASPVATARSSKEITLPMPPILSAAGLTIRPISRFFAPLLPSP